MDYELLYTPVYVAPTQEELRSMLGGAYAGCKAIRDFAQANYAVEERWRYSDKRDAFDCLIFNGDRRLCSLHLRQGRTALLVMLSAQECAQVEARWAGISPAVRDCFSGADQRDGERWIRIALTSQSNASLRDIFSLIRLKAELTGIERRQDKNYGDDEK